MPFNWFVTAFAGWRLALGRPVTFITWLVVIFIVLVVLALLAGAFRGMGDSVQILSAIVPAVVIGGLVAAWVHRAVLEPGGSGYGYLGFGAAEFRNIVLMVGLMAAAFLGVFLVSAGLELFGLAAGVEAIVGLIVTTLLAGSLAGPVSLVGPAVSDLGWRGVGEGWRMASGHRLRLAGMCLVAVTVTALAFTAFQMLVVASITGLGSQTSWLVLLWAPVGLAGVVGVAGPGVAAYAKLRQAQAAVDVFD